jgi:hypothetical protein
MLFQSSNRRGERIKGHGRERMKREEEGLITCFFLCMEIQSNEGLGLAPCHIPTLKKKFGRQKNKI